MDGVAVVVVAVSAGVLWLALMALLNAKLVKGSVRLVGADVVVSRSLFRGGATRIPRTEVVRLVVEPCHYRLALTQGLVLVLADGAHVQTLLTQAAAGLPAVFWKMVRSAASGLGLEAPEQRRQEPWWEFEARVERERTRGERR
jgi:hypothetical protein